MTVIAPSAGNSLANPETKDIFSSEENILRALAFVRHSPIPVKQKDILRDLFLNYAGSYDEPRRQEVRKQILEVLKSQPELKSLLPKTEARTKASAPSPDHIGSTRPVPSFGMITPAPPVPDKPPAPLPKPEVAPTPIAEAAPITKPKPEAPAAPAPKIPPLPPTPPPAPAPQPVNQNAKARIDIIKRDINGKVGNPVNLIETDEKVGREYMSALLDAMRRSGKGDNDLSRLENAYQAALSVIEKGVPAAATTPVVANSAPTSPAPAEAPLPKVPPVVVAAAPKPTPPKTEPVATPVPESTIVTSPPAPEAPQSGLYHKPSDEVEASLPTKAPKEPKPKVFASLSSKLLKQEAVAELKETPIAKPQEVIPPPPSAKVGVEIKSVDPPPATTPRKQEEKLRPVKDIDATLPEQISKLKAAAEVREEAAKKPITNLNAPEIDQGLKQLLSEWSLFKGGGFFRTKPSGIDSALYKQLSKMPMASVIAGRFEGVTPEIKRDLADYMTGWRYERGIVHEMGETFEHYLRRVVKEILERQRRAKAADTPTLTK